MVNTSMFTKFGTEIVYCKKINQTMLYIMLIVSNVCQFETTVHSSFTISYTYVDDSYAKEPICDCILCKLIVMGIILPSARQDLKILYRCSASEKTCLGSINMCEEHLTINSRLTFMNMSG
jgi:hypothetical protein